MCTELQYPDFGQEYTNGVELNMSEVQTIHLIHCTELKHKFNLDNWRHSDFIPAIVSAIYM